MINKNRMKKWVYHLVKIKGLKNKRLVYYILIKDIGPAKYNR